MPKALIVEDRAESRKALQRIISERYPQIQMDTAATYEEAVVCLNQSEYDIFLLDINLSIADSNDTSGLKFAKEIRSRRGYEFTPIVMITSISNLEIAAYREIHCYQYIIKPFVKEAVISVMKKVLEGKQQEERNCFVFKSDGINYKVDCADILYLKAVPRGITLVMKQEEIKVLYLTLRTALDKLPKEFIQCHRMYAINTEYLEYCDFVNQLVKLKGCEQTIEIGGTYKAKLKQYMETLLEQ